jgi:23S rRNA (cytidine1920-2'-O)/16S rRNA (cytidine1409-2'-O)-methyltransferase
MAKSERLDNYLVQVGLADTIPQAQRLVMAGQVRVNGQVLLKPDIRIAGNAAVTLDKGPRFVSRGGSKLEAAFQAFSLQAHGRICADVGSSTGGFTDCLLQHGASKVFAIDVGKGILDWRLRQDSRVVVMESVNARDLYQLPEPVSLVTLDVSFISLRVLLPIVLEWLDARQTNEIIALVKPQFEAERELSSRGRGVIRDPAIHRQVLQEVLSFAQDLGCQVCGLIRSPLLGPKGNVEFLAWMSYPAHSTGSFEMCIEKAVIGQPGEQTKETGNH